MKKNQKQKEKEKALQELKNILKPGDIIYTIIRSVSKSGLTRVISFYIIKDNIPVLLDWYISQALNLPLTKEGVKVSGVGTDMGAWAVYQLSYALFEDGYQLNQKWL